jgi:nicotinamide mononucleotide (NMN) deamidase PncC
VSYYYGYTGMIRHLREDLQSDDLALQDQLRATRRQLQEVAVTLGVALELLQQANLLDPAVVHARVAEQLAQGPTTAVCITCGKAVPVGQTTITAMGTVCDACARK